ncbi:MAG: hypothetical protein ABR956_17585 [Terracidiphilus sp.]|jgi:hypothetical protein
MWRTGIIAANESQIANSLVEVHYSRNVGLSEAIGWRWGIVRGFAA